MNSIDIFYIVLAYPPASDSRSIEKYIKRFESRERPDICKKIKMYLYVHRFDVPAERRKLREERWFERRFFLIKKF